jgi:hypothetical protein
MHRGRGGNKENLSIRQYTHVLLGRLSLLTPGLHHGRSLRCCWGLRLLVPLPFEFQIQYHLPLILLRELRLGVGFGILRFGSGLWRCLGLCLGSGRKRGASAEE